MKYYLLTPFLALFILCSSLSFSAQAEDKHEIVPLIPTEHTADHMQIYDDMTKIQTTEDSGDFTGKFMHMLFILALLVGFMIVASLMLKKMTRTRVTQMNQQSLIKVLEARTLSPKSTLYLLNIEGKELLIAESHAGVTHLATFPGAYHFDFDEKPAASSDANDAGGTTAT